MFFNIFGKQTEPWSCHSLTIQTCSFGITFSQMSPDSKKISQYGENLPIIINACGDFQLTIQINPELVDTDFQQPYQLILKGTGTDCETIPFSLTWGGPPWTRNIPDTVTTISLTQESKVDCIRLYVVKSLQEAQGLVNSITSYLPKATPATTLISQNKLSDQMIVCPEHILIGADSPFKRIPSYTTTTAHLDISSLGIDTEVFSIDCDYRHWAPTYYVLRVDQGICYLKIKILGSSQTPQGELSIEEYILSPEQTYGTEGLCLQSCGCPQNVLLSYSDGFSNIPITIPKDSSKFVQISFFPDTNTVSAQETYIQPLHTSIIITSLKEIDNIVKVVEDVIKASFSQTI